MKLYLGSFAVILKIQVLSCQLYNHKCIVLLSSNLLTLTQEKNLETDKRFGSLIYIFK